MAQLQGHNSRMCKGKNGASRIEGETYQKSNASVYNACEEQEFEETSSSEDTIIFAEQTATVEEVHHIGSNVELHSIKLKGHDV